MIQNPGVSWLSIFYGVTLCLQCFSSRLLTLAESVCHRSALKQRAVLLLTKLSAVLPCALRRLRSRQRHSESLSKRKKRRFSALRVCVPRDFSSTKKLVLTGPPLLYIPLLYCFDHKCWDKFILYPRKPYPTFGLTLRYNKTRCFFPWFTQNWHTF